MTNTDKIHILIHSHIKAGIGSVFNSVLLSLEKIIHDYPNIKPYIIWNMPNYTDTENENIWLKYFDLIGFDENIENDYINKYHNKNIVFTTDNSILYAGEGFVDTFRSDYRRTLHNIYSQHIHVKPIIISKIDTMFKHHSGKSLIGVHLRNTDNYIDLGPGGYPGVDKISLRLLNVLQDTYINNDVCIYIASDNIPDVIFLKEFIQNNYTGSYIFIEDPDNVRSPNHISVHGAYDEGINVSKDAKALSILTDIFALAKCELIIRICSNVTIASSIININAKIIDISLEYGHKTEPWLISNSQCYQDLKVIEFYKKKKNGFFIEAGASDGIELSNTYLLEKDYNWTGICIEPIFKNYEKLIINRPKSLCYNDAIYNESGLILHFDIAICDDKLSGISNHIDTHKSYIDKNKNTITVNTVSLLDLLDKSNAPKFIEYLSLDTEGSEYEILKNFNFDKYIFGLIHVEHNCVEPRRTYIRDLLIANNYIYLGQNKFDDMYKHVSV
jgi:FkbM family methyltransferase